MTDSPRGLSRPGAAPKCQQWQTLDPLFGCRLSEAERLGDVDIAVELLPKVAEEAEFRKWCDRCRYAAREQVSASAWSVLIWRMQNGHPFIYYGSSRTMK